MSESGRVGRAAWWMGLGAICFYSAAVVMLVLIIALPLWRMEAVRGAYEPGGIEKLLLVAAFVLTPVGMISTYLTYLFVVRMLRRRLPGHNEDRLAVSALPVALPVLGIWYYRRLTSEAYLRRMAGYGESHTDRPKRLSILWLICVVFAQAAAVNVMAAATGTPVGATLFGTFSVLFLLTAWMLWRRHRGAWLLGLILWDVWSLFCLVVATGMPGLPLLTVWAVCAAAVSCYMTTQRHRFDGKSPAMASAGSLLIIACLLLSFAPIALLAIDNRAETFDELAAQPPVSPADNGFLVVEEMASRSFSEDHYVDECLWRNVPRVDAQRYAAWLDEARKTLEVNRWHLEKVAEILDRRAFQRPPFPNPFGTDAMLADMVYHRVPRYVAELIALRSSVALAEGRHEDAARDARDLMELGLRVGGSGGGIISYLVGQVVLGMGMSQAREVAYAANEPAVTRTLCNALLDVEPRSRQAFGDAIRGEYHLSRTIPESISSPEQLRKFAYIALTNDTPTAVALQEKLFRHAPFMLPNHFTRKLGACYLRLLSEASKPYLRQERPFERPNVGALDNLRNPIGMALYRESTRGGDSFLRTRARHVAEIRAARLALAAVAYRQELGAWPEDLKALVPEFVEALTTDPFTGEDFVYEVVNGAATITSVGPEGKRDPEDAESYERDDVVVTVPEPR